MEEIMKEVVIVSGSRTAIGNFGGVFKSVTAVQLGSIVLQDVLSKAGLRPAIDKNAAHLQPALLPDESTITIDGRHTWDDTLRPIVIDEVIMGNVLQAGIGQNPARQSMVSAGYSVTTPAFTINKVCASGLKAIAIGASAIMTGQSEVIVAGGQESMSNCPMALPKGRWGHRMEISGAGEVTDLLVHDGLYEKFYGYHMGITAENIAALYGISREDQDALALISHTRARHAITNNLFDDEIVPVSLPLRNGNGDITVDERPMDTTMEKLARLRPVFKKDGSVTAGNASGVNDGAAAVLMMSAERAKELQLTPFATIAGFGASGLDPAYMGLGPVPAIRKTLANTGMEIGDIDLIELNEAFAAQAIGCMKELNIDLEKPNELGSGISLGHPIGCTGARQMVTAIHQLQRKSYETGLISMCIGGGMGMAMTIRR